jgi:hypothetical protein
LARVEVSQPLSFPFRVDLRHGSPSYSDQPRGNWADRA